MTIPLQVMTRTRAGTPLRPRPAPQRLGLPALLAAAVLAATAALLPAGAHGATILDVVDFMQTDIRALAMGNAYGAVGRGEGALLYNPAGLAQFDLDLKVEFSADLAGTSTDFLLDSYALLSNTGLTAINVVDYLDKYDGSTHQYRGQAYHSAIANLGKFNLGLGYGLLEAHRYQFVFTDTGPAGFDPLAIPPETDSLTVDHQVLRANLAGLALKLFSGKLMVGVTAKTVEFTTETTGAVAFTSFSGTSLNLTFTGNDFKRVTAYDAGFIYRMEFFAALRPQWSVTAANVGGYKFKSDTVATVYEVPQTLNVGLALNPQLPVLNLLLSFEYKDPEGKIRIDDPGTGTVDPEKRSPTQSFHAGLELGLFKTSTGNNVLSLRAGSNRGRLTYGAEVNLVSLLRVAYTHYGDDMGNSNHSVPKEWDAIHLGVGLAW
ncbi:MAG: hypothetical protein HY423_14320 [Candidatus Lambdaproteobacteria bacterium]|nr:hypothetical protein [Candidatus Lambdaproteobacteria bacterium]